MGKNVLNGCLSLLLFLASQANAESSFKGFSTYAAMHPKFPCERFVKIAKEATFPAMSVLYGTFGRDERCLACFTDVLKGRHHAVQIHLTNETCRRNGRTCLRGEINPEMSTNRHNRTLERMGKRIERKYRFRLRRIAALAKRIGTVKTDWLISTGLEDEYTKKAYDNILKIVKEEWPYAIVRNPLSDNDPYIGSAHLIELHSSEARFRGMPCIFNQDGLTGGMLQAKLLFAKFSSCKLLFAWTPGAQGVGKVFVAPMERYFQISQREVLEYGEFLRRAE